MLIRRDCICTGKWFFGVLAAIFGMLLFTHFTTAAPTPQLTYHGKLTDTNNIPVADGTYTFTLSIYDAPTNGNCLWTARGDCTTKQAKTLTITKGIFHTTLGETGDNPLTLDFNQDYYLEIQIGTNTPMTPRRTITPTGSAINAERLNGKTADNYINTTDNQTKAGTLTLQNNLTLNSSLTDNVGSTGALNQVLAIREGGVVRWNNIEQLINTLAFMVGGNYTASPAIFGTKNNYDLVFQTNNTEQMRLLANGNLGIGTAAPTERLGINGNIDFQSPITVPARPTAALNDVAGNLNGSYAYRVTYVDAQGRQTEVSLNSAYISTVNQQMIVTIPVSADPRVMARKIYRNKAKANATAGPWHLVTTVNDNATTTYNDNIADTALPNTYGPSINTTAGTLYVNGMPFLSAATSSTAVGFRALQNNGGIGSTGFGYQALFSNTGNDASGFGLNALFANTGSYVAAFGSGALQNNIVSYASGFGYAALQNNTGGTASGFGYSALQNNTGGDSSGFGYQALQDNSGLYSSGFGYQALRTNTGNYAAGFGYRALSSNTAANSTGFGYVSLQRNKGLNSTGVGAFALQDNQGNESAGVGFMALQNNTGGSSVGIGSYALQYNTAATAIGIGHFSLRYNTGGYSFGIGNSALYSNTGTNAYGFGSSALAQNIGGGAIGIGYNALQINTGLNATGLGNYTLQNNTGAYAIGMGTYTLLYNQGDHNIAIGRAAFNNFNENTAAEKTFAPTDIDITTERITITTHGFGADNAYINLRFKTTGTAPGGLTNNAIYQFKIIDTNTLEIVQGSQKMDLTSQGTGTHTLTPQHVYSNSIAIGYDTEPTASNQIMMGNNATTELISGADGTVNLGSATHRWNTVYATNGTINTSDITQKKNINTLTYGLNEILSINPISFHWKNDEFGTKTKIGFSAQELQHIIPEVVSQGKDNTLGIYYADLIPVAFNAIKQQQQLIHTNTNTITQHTGILQKVQSDITAQNTKVDHITHIQKLQTDILTLKQDTQNYHTVIDDLKLQLEQAQAGIDLLTAMSTQQTTDLTALLAIDPGRIVLWDVDAAGALTNTITLDGIMVVRRVTTEGLVMTGDADRATIGEAVIAKGAVDVFVPTEAAVATSRIFITPKGGAVDQTLSVSAIDERSGFHVTVVHPVGADVAFDWMIVEDGIDRPTVTTRDSAELPVDAATMPTPEPTADTLTVNP